MTEIRKKSLWIDPNQGETKHGKAFGFVGTRDTGEYQGWFFTWPGESAVIRTIDDREAVLDSLDSDETNHNEKQIPYRWARQKLKAYLTKNFDLRTKS